MVVSFVPAIVNGASGFCRRFVYPWGTAPAIGVLP